MDESQHLQSAPLNLPRRIQDQSLLGYMRQHVDLLDALVASGIKMGGLVLAMKAAGFIDCRPGVFENALHRARHHPKRRPVRAPDNMDAIARAALPPPVAMPARPPLITAEQLRKTSRFNYQGTVNLDTKKYV